MNTSGDYTTTLARKRMGAGVLFTDHAGRVLIAEPVYKTDWEIIGGAVDQDESPRKAAAREVKEELGKTISPGRLLVVDWVPPTPNRTEGVMFVYDGGTLSTNDTIDFRLPPDELRDWAWCTQEQVQQRMSQLLARRVIAALTAKAEGSMFELENGFHIGRSSTSSDGPSLR